MAASANTLHVPQGQGQPISLLRRHGPLVLILAGLFGWVVTLPLFGPVGIALAGEQIAYLANWFLLAHAAGLITWGFLLDRYPHLAKGAVGVALLISAVLTLMLRAVPAGSWPPLFALMGLTAASVVAWGRWYATTVGSAWLGRIFALAAAGTNLIKYLFSLAIGKAPPHTLLLLALAPLLLAALSLPFLDETAHPSRATDSLSPAAPQVRTRSLVRYLAFILFFSLVAGLSYRFLDVAPISPFVRNELGLLTYMVAVLIAGYLADRRSLQLVMVAGSGLLALAFLIGAWGEPRAQFAGVLLNGAAFGLLESAPWLLLASSATARTAGRWFGWGLNVNVVPIFLGAAVGPALGQLSLEHLGLLAAVALMLATWSLYGALDPLAVLHGGQAHLGMGAGPSVAGARPASSTPGGHRPQALAPAELLRLRYGEVLSERELEVGQLAISGMSTREIALGMYISENTVKTHLKNLYRKTQTANRNDLYRRLVENGR